MNLADREARRHSGVPLSWSASWDKAALTESCLPGGKTLPASTAVILKWCRTMNCAVARLRIRARKDYGCKKAARMSNPGRQSLCIAQTQAGEASQR